MAPYRHFVGIEALLAAVATRGFELFAARLRKGDASARDPYQALIELGAAYVVFACDEPALFKLMFGAARPQGDPALAQAAKTAYGMLGSITLRRGCARRPRRPFRRRKPMLRAPAA